MARVILLSDDCAIALPNLRGCFLPEARSCLWGYLKKNCLCFIVLVCFMQLNAQQKQVDSLVSLLQQHTTRDTTRLNLLNEISFSYYSLNAGKGIVMADSAISLAKQLDNKLKLATAYRYKGIHLQSNGEDTAALDLYNQALKIYSQAGNQQGIANVYNNFGLVYFGMSNYPKALEYHLTALGIYEQLHDKQRIANALNNTGVDYQFLADYPKALEYYLKALALAQQSGNKQAIGNTYTNIGLVHNKLSQFPKALEYQQKAYATFEEMGNQQGMANTLGNMGNVYDNMDNTDKSLECFEKAIVINERIGNKRRIASDFVNIGTVYTDIPDYAKAIEYVQKAIDIYENLGDNAYLASTLTQMSIIYSKAPDDLLIKNGVPASKRFAKALEYQRKALLLSKEAGAVDIEVTAWEAISNTYEKQHNTVAALEAYKNFILLRDSIVNDEKKQAIAQKQMQFEFEKKEVLLKAEHDKKEALALAEIKRERIVKNAVVAGALTLLLAAIGGSILYKRKRDADEQKKEAELKARVTDTEMKALRSQMNPHFIFNSLNSINDYISKHDMRAADEYLTKFARLMRMILENSEKREVPLGEDLKALELYMQLESLRLRNGFSYEIKIDDALDKENTLVPPLILQPFVENSIWHGLSKKREGGKILIEIKKEGDMINCIVEDNGAGRSMANLVDEHGQKKSFGMKITSERIDVINQLKKTNATVQVSDLQQGVKVEVRLPLELNF